LLLINGLGYLVRCLLVLFLVPTWSIVQGVVRVLGTVPTISLGGCLVMLSVSYETY
jgi:hypothetical protein